MTWKELSDALNFGGSPKTRKKKVKEEPLDLPPVEELAKTIYIYDYRNDFRQSGQYDEWLKIKENANEIREKNRANGVMLTSKQSYQLAIAQWIHDNNRWC